MRLYSSMMILSLSFYGLLVLTLALKAFYGGHMLSFPALNVGEFGIFHHTWCIEMPRLKENEMDFFSNDVCKQSVWHDEATITVWQREYENAVN